ncbi:hypothetical protein D9758_016427 [Tetrapyrgos nigripes]|uniref:Myb/SANT-like domain-containing protein n=1 Tax=Tetrapyrgos nigripes TaxID=182062 RepID=A0A8H5C0P4_9AGAR|nr:hypothetical protein D9758_016427 [Tetrapyrgos nigripes]
MNKGSKSRRLSLRILKQLEDEKQAAQDEVDKALDKKIEAAEDLKNEDIVREQFYMDMVALVKDKKTPFLPFFPSSRPVLLSNHPPVVTLLILMQAKWSNSDVDIMIDELKNQKAQGNQSQSGWKPDTWTTVSKRIIAEGSQEGAEKNPKKCSDKYGTLKAQYKAVHYIRTKALGFGWDEQKQMVVATPFMLVVLPLEPSQSQEELIEWPSSPPASAPPPSSNSNLTVLASVSAAVPITTPARKTSPC